MITRDQAIELDRTDPLAGFRERFVIADPDLIYLDGNSLGRLPRATIDQVQAAMVDEWGSGLVRSWRSGWMAKAADIGARLAPLIGAHPDEVLLTDQTSVNLYKLAVAGLAARAPRNTILTDSGNFPSDIYVLNGVAQQAGGSVRMVGADPVAPSTTAIEAALDEQVGLVSLSHVNFKSGALLDMASITRAAHDAGAFALWDLSHSVGVVPVDLHGSGTDLAVGCTYKYLNGGPGAPAFLFVSRELQERLTQPIQGWWGHENMFGFALDYRPAAGMARFATGTMPILSLVGAGVGIDLSVAAGIDAIRTKSRAMTALMIDLFDDLPAAHGFSLGSPRRAEQRGGHVSLRHEDGFRIASALIDRGVVPDFRAPDVIRLGAAPLYVRFVDVWDAFARLTAIMDAGAHLGYSDERDGVT
ncbi:MAG: kynureninase [Acidimicrobiia bacterium]|nr:kynureninase [Acidimicrobiia bacterium]